MTLSKKEKIELASDPSTSEETLIELSTEGDEEVRMEVLWNDNIPDDALLNFKDLPYFHEKLEFMRREGIEFSENLIRGLADSKNPFVLRLIAYSKNCPGDILSKLSEHESS
ncbi:MAG TPA: hypothetical protein PLC12_04250, partial [Candidatus Methanofastidiosa archaeon]|nr:hypothetical protein [Candidatus Methanofastidiosa archaeon]